MQLISIYLDMASLGGETFENGLYISGCGQQSHKGSESTWLSTDNRAQRLKEQIQHGISFFPVTLLTHSDWLEVISLITALETPSLWSSFLLYYLNSIWHSLLSFINHYHWQKCPFSSINFIPKTLCWQVSCPASQGTDADGVLPVIPRGATSWDM